MSGLGKGIVSSSIGKILQSKGYKVVPIKFDGYLNVDCGTMNPFRHGEVFVLRCGLDGRIHQVRHPRELGGGFGFARGRKTGDQSDSEPPVSFLLLSLEHGNADAPGEPSGV